MLEGPIGAAAFNNEFGRPALTGYFRTFEYAVNPNDLSTVRGYHKPVMVAGGIGTVRGEHVSAAAVYRRHATGGARWTVDVDRPWRRCGVFDGIRPERFEPRFRIGAARQRRNAAPLSGSDRCVRGAGCGESDPAHSRCGRRRAVERAARTGQGRGTRRPFRDTPRAKCRSRACAAGDLVQRGAGALCTGSWSGDLATFEAICERERCPFAIVGDATREPRLVVEDAAFDNRPVDLPMDVLFARGTETATFVCALCAIGVAAEAGERDTCRRIRSRIAVSRRSDRSSFSSLSATAALPALSCATRWWDRGRYRLPMRR